MLLIILLFSCLFCFGFVWKKFTTRTHSLTNTHTDFIISTDSGWWYFSWLLLLFTFYADR